ncbi:MAG: hypothetical protein AAF797_10200 [Planctomycetota bacterium]
MNHSPTQLASPIKANLSRLGIATAVGIALLIGTSASADRYHSGSKHKAKTTTVHHDHHIKIKHKNLKLGWHLKHTHRGHHPTHRATHRATHRDRCSIPRYHHRTLAPRQHWVPGYWSKQYIPPKYGWRYNACGTRYRVVVRHGYHKNVWVPGRWTNTHRSHRRAYH